LCLAGIALKRHWSDISGPEIIKEWPEEDRHWLLGHKVQSTATPEANYLFYLWDRPDSFEL
jgi:hypothetical protein